MKLFNTTVNYGPLREDPLVLQQAHEIGSKGQLNGRTREQKMEHALNGCALEHAVRLDLRAAGFEVLDPLDKTHDLRVRTKHGELKVDVKGRFAQSGKTLTMSSWEAQNADDETVYLVFDCDGEDAQYRGWFSLLDIEEEGRYGPFVYLGNLNKTNPFD